MAAEGFKVLGVEIEPEIAEMYKHPVICEDVRNLDPENYKGYDLIVGSPPCRDFCKFALSVGKRWKNPPDPEGRGMELVNAFLNFVEVSKPTYWLMENVPQLRNYLNLKPRGIVRLSKQRYRAFWGNYPGFLVPRDLSLKHMTNHKGETNKRNNGKFAQWENAYIPATVSRALGKSTRTAIRHKRRTA